MDNNLVNEWNQESIEEQKIRKDEWAIKILGIEVCNAYLFINEFILSSSNLDALLRY